MNVVCCVQGARATPNPKTVLLDLLFFVIVLDEILFRKIILPLEIKSIKNPNLRQLLQFTKGEIEAQRVN